MVDQNAKYRTIKLLEKHIGGNLLEFEFDKNFLYMTPKAQCN